MFEYLRYQYYGGKFTRYVQLFYNSRKSRDLITSIKQGAKAIEVGEKLLDLENRLAAHPMKLSVKHSLSEIKAIYETLQEEKEVRERKARFGTLRAIS